MVPRKKTLAKTVAKKEASAEEKKVPAVVEKKETAVAEVAKKETAVAPVQKKETAVAEVVKKETAVAEVVKKEKAVAEVPKKETAKKTTAKKATKTTTAAKTTASKKAAAKTEIKTATYVQYAGAEISVEKLETEAKKAYLALGHKEDEIETLTLYVKPEEHAVYYVVNGEGSDKYKIVY